MIYKNEKEVNQRMDELTLDMKHQYPRSEWAGCIFEQKYKGCEMGLEIN